MFCIGLILMISGLIIGLCSIYRTIDKTISPVALGWTCYIGLFMALLGAVFIGKVW